MVSANAGGNDELQFQQVMDMIKAGIKVLVLLPHDTSKASGAWTPRRPPNVEVDELRSPLQNSDVDLYVSFDRLEIVRYRRIPRKTRPQRQLRAYRGLSE